MKHFTLLLAFWMLNMGLISAQTSDLSLSFAAPIEGGGFENISVNGNGLEGIQEISIRIPLNSGTLPTDDLLPELVGEGWMGNSETSHVQSQFSDEGAGKLFLDIEIHSLQANGGSGSGAILRVKKSGILGSVWEDFPRVSSGGGLEFKAEISTIRISIPAFSLSGDVLLIRKAQSVSEIKLYGLSGQLMESRKLESRNLESQEIPISQSGVGFIIWRDERGEAFVCRPMVQIQ